MTLIKFKSTIWSKVKRSFFWITCKRLQHHFGWWHLQRRRNICQGFPWILADIVPGQNEEPRPGHSNRTETGQSCCSSEARTRLHKSCYFCKIIDVLVKTPTRDFTMRSRCWAIFVICLHLQRCWYKDIFANYGMVLFQVYRPAFLGNAMKPTSIEHKY